MASPAQYVNMHKILTLYHKGLKLAPLFTKKRFWLSQPCLQSEKPAGFKIGRMYNSSKRLMGPCVIDSVTDMRIDRNFPQFLYHDSKIL